MSAPIVIRVLPSASRRNEPAPIPNGRLYPDEERVAGEREDEPDPDREERALR